MSAGPFNNVAADLKFVRRCNPCEQFTQEGAISQSQMERDGGQVRNIPRAPFISRSMIKPDSSLMVLEPPNFWSTLPSQLRVRLVYASLTSKTRDHPLPGLPLETFLEPVIVLEAQHHPGGLALNLPFSPAGHFLRRPARRSATGRWVSNLGSKMTR